MSVEHSRHARVIRSIENALIQSGPQFMRTFQFTAYLLFSHNQHMAQIPTKISLKRNISFHNNIKLNFLFNQKKKNFIVLSRK